MSAHREVGETERNANREECKQGGQGDQGGKKRQGGK
jgi:hypothetical protein